MNMKLELVPIDSIRPDPNQPRTIVSQKQIEEMSASIKTEGVINPVEIDHDNMIVTGEMRWRAAKHAGLTEVYVKRIDITDPSHRFLRQVIENIHHNTMTPLDTARAIAKLLNRSPGEQLQKGKDYGQSELGRKLGKAKSWMSDMIGLLSEDQETQEYLESPESNYTFIREVNKTADDEHKQYLKKKIFAGEIKDRDTITELVQALKRTPDKADELLRENYTDRVMGNIHKIHTISPPTVLESKKIEESPKARARHLAREISAHVIKLLELMKALSMEDLEDETLTMLIQTLGRFPAFFMVFQKKLEAIHNKRNSHKLPEGAEKE